MQLWTQVSSDILQEALTELVHRTRPSPLPTRISGLLPTWAEQQAPFLVVPGGGKGRNAVHPVPVRHMSQWRSSDSSSDEEEQQEPSEQLLAAAMFLLHDPTLAVATNAGWDPPPQPPRNWDSLVQQQVAANFRAAASSKLLAMRNAVPSASSRMVFASQVSHATCINASLCV